MDRIGSRLVADGSIDEEQLRDALDRQRTEGGPVGHHLIEGGFITRPAFYAALARHWGLPVRDLVREPPDPRLIGAADIGSVEESIALGWVACELTEDGTVVVATSVRPALEVEVEVEERFPGRRVEFVACTRRDLDRVALGLRRSPGESRPAGSAGGALARGVEPLRRHRTAPGRTSSAGGRSDLELPLYSVIVRVWGGEEWLRAVLDRLAALDYPAVRLDAVLLVAEGDETTTAAVRRLAPPEWVRVLPVPDGDFADVVVAIDHGLALARGRYVVALGRDSAIGRDELRCAVDAFESDLDGRLDRGEEAAPLSGLRADRPRGLRRRPAAHEAKSVHCITPLLRRLGGFGALVD